MPIYQCHEQNNELVKGSGGAVGLTENPSAFQKWMMVGPEQARLLKEFECEFMPEVSDNQFHHEESLWTQKAFKKQMQSLAEEIREIGNPFLHDNAQLLDNTTSICETIKKNNLPLFRQPTPKSKGKQAGRLQYKNALK